MNRNTTLLVEACRAGDEDKILELLKNDDVDVNEIDKYMMTPLHYAVQHQLSQVVQQLCSKPEIDPNIQNREKKTPIHLAASCKNHGLIDALLRISHININMKDKNNLNPLDIAVKQNNIYFIEALSHTSDIKVDKYSFSHNPILTAAESGSSTCLQLMLNSNQFKEDLTSAYIDYLLLAAQRNHLECVRILVQTLADELTGITKTLLQLLLNGDTESIRTLITNNACNVNQTLLSGWTMLHVAVLLQNKALVSFLLRLPHIDVNAINRNKYSALALASMAGSADIVKLLIQHEGVEVNSNWDSEIPLCLACQYGNVACVKALLEHPYVDVNIRNYSRNTPLYYALINKHPSCVRALLECDRISILKIDRDESNAFYYAFLLYQAASLSYLLNYVYSSSTEQEFPLQRAILNDDIDSISALLSHPSVDVNMEDEHECTPLLIAVFLNRPEIIKLLLQHNDIQVNKQYYFANTVLYYAVHLGYTECIKELLQHPGIDTSIMGTDYHTPLQVALKQNSMACIEALLCSNARHTCSRGFFGKNFLHAALGSVVSLEYLLSTNLFHLNERDQNGSTLFLSAASSYSAAFFLLRVHKGVILTAQDYSGLTALHSCVMYSSLTVVSALLKQVPLLLNVQNKHGSTPLHTACVHWHRSMFSLLLRCASVLVNMEDENGQTPLHRAVTEQEIDHVRALLARDDIDVNVCDNKGKTPLHYAVENKEKGKEIIKALLAHKDICTKIKDNDGKTPLDILSELHFGEKDEIMFLFQQKSASA